MYFRNHKERIIVILYGYLLIRFFRFCFASEQQRIARETKQKSFSAKTRVASPRERSLSSYFCFRSIDFVVQLKISILILYLIFNLKYDILLIKFNIHIDNKNHCQHIIEKVILLVLRYRKNVMLKQPKYDFNFQLINY